MIGGLSVGPPLWPKLFCLHLFTGVRKSQCLETTAEPGWVLAFRAHRPEALKPQPVCQMVAVKGLCSLISGVPTALGWSGTIPTSGRASANKRSARCCGRLEPLQHREETPGHSTVRGPWEGESRACTKPWAHGNGTGRLPEGFNPGPAAPVTVL